MMIKIVKLIFIFLVFCSPLMLLGQNKNYRYFKVLTEDKSCHVGIQLCPDGFFNCFSRLELMDVYQRGIYLETDSTLELIPVFEVDSINIISIYQIGLADSGNVKILFYDIFNNPLRVSVSANGVDWSGATNVATISDSTSMINIKSVDFEFDYLTDVFVRREPYRWDAPHLLSLDSYRGKEIKVIMSEQLMSKGYQGRQWWEFSFIAGNLMKKHKREYISANGNIQLKSIPSRTFYKDY